MIGLGGEIGPGAEPAPPARQRIDHWRSSPPALLLYSFLFLVTVGTLLLKAPWATHQSISVLQALFTATSAVTVTGLVVVDTGSYFTLAGQVVILMLVQLGGIGLMTFAVVTAQLLGFRIGLRQQLIAKEALNQTSLKKVTIAARSIIGFVLLIELLGALVLMVVWVPESGIAAGVYNATFYAVSAFNNAGFALAPDGLSGFATEAPVIITISLLYIIGGLGYLVVMELWEKRRHSQLSVYTRVVLHASLALALVGALAFLALEYNNPQTLGQFSSMGDKLLVAWFQGTVPRSSGFNTIDIGSITNATTTLFLLLMFIGGAPNSTASGIKITTFVILLAATRAFLRGSLVVSLYNRTLSNEMVIKALAIAVVGMSIAFLTVLGLSITEKAAFIDIVFEALSAFGTVGLSRGLTPELSAAGQILVVVVMLIGRVGPLTLGYMLTLPRRSQIRHARVEFPVG